MKKKLAITPAVVIASFRAYFSIYSALMELFELNLYTHFNPSLNSIFGRENTV